MLAELLKEHHQLVLYLLIAIAVILVSTFILFNITLSKRWKKIKQEKARKTFEEKIEALLFEYIFESIQLNELQSKIEEIQLDDTKKGILIKAIVSLFQSYTGNVQERLQEAYRHIGLVHFSFKKLNHKKWEYRVEGIRDLSDLGVYESVNNIEKYVHDTNRFVQCEAITALVKLNGIERLSNLLKSDFVIDDWTQTNILYTLKRQIVPEPKNWSELLKSENDSLISLVIRMMTHYNVKFSGTVLYERISKLKSKKMQLELVQLIQKNFNQENS